MMIQVLIDMRAFFLVLLYSVLAFTLLSVAIESKIPKEKSENYVFDTYLIMLGEFVNMPTSDEGWILFILLTVINTILLLNLIISVISDTYDRV